MSYMKKIMASCKPGSPLKHKPPSGRDHIHTKYHTSYEGDATFPKDKKKGGKVVKADHKPSPTKFTSKAVYHGYNDRKDPPVRSGDKSSPAKKKGPCWSGYEMVGMKKKGGRTVPNCVPKKK